MRTEYLVRFGPTPDGTLGRLGPWAVLEEEDQGNQANISSIPVGTYICRRSMYNRGGYETFEVTDVPGRSRILFHVINTEEDTEGCIGLGMRFGVLAVNDEDRGVRTHKLAILSSRQAFDQFMESLDGIDQFALVVTEHGKS